MRTWSFLLLAGLCLVGCRAPKPSTKTPVPSVIISRPYNPTAIQKQVEALSQSVKRDPQGAIAYGMLSRAYLQRYRETGELQDVERAIQAAKRSLAIRTRHNDAAYTALAQGLATRHQFGEAHSAAQSALKLNPANAQAKVVSVESLVEQGRYSEAEKEMNAPPSLPNDAFGKTLRARLLWLNGDAKRAEEEYRNALKEAEGIHEIPNETLAWFHLRLGECLFQRGDLGGAEPQFQQALALFPKDYRALTFLARLAACKEDWNGAKGYAERAVALVPTPEALATLFSIYAGLNDAAGKDKTFRLLDSIHKLSKAQGVRYDRQRALFSADQQRDLLDALKLAKAELLVRQDIYAYDALAWVLCRLGRNKEAQVVMEKALARGTQDPKLFYHAGCIAYGRGDRETAKKRLIHALELNPHFDPLGAKEARELLQTL